MARLRNRVTGVNAAMRAFDGELKAKHRLLVSAGRRVEQFLLKGAQDRAPLMIGDLAGTIVSDTEDKGFGNGAKVIVKNSGLIYANRRHEERYNAHKQGDYDIKTSKKTGKRYRVAVKNSAGADGLVMMGNGIQRGRKYLDRTLDELMPKVERVMQDFDK